MGVSGKPIGDPYPYKGHMIEVTAYAVDFLCYVDGQQVGDFWTSADAAQKAGKRHVDLVEKEKTT